MYVCMLYIYIYIYIFFLFCFFVKDKIELHNSKLKALLTEIKSICKKYLATLSPSL